MASHKKKVLLFQTRSRAEAAEKERDNYRSSLGSAAKLDCLWSLDQSISKKDAPDILAGYDGVIFGGSSDYDFDGGRMTDDPFRLVAMIIMSRTSNLISYALVEKVPILGICFGHQMIANMHGGEVKLDPEQRKGGTFEVSLTAEGKKDRLFGTLPPKFLAQFVHKDSVTKLPRNSTLLATAPNCRFSALRFGENAYTMQFHPEKSAERVLENLRATPSLVPAGAEPSSLVGPSPDAARLISLWLEKVVV